MAEPLDPLTLPLRGSRLIEASAGTGKTWTIAALYLRLVLGHGAEGCAAVRPLLPGEILVMTFTKAATRELSDRIRSRLVEAAACFRGERLPEAHDSFLADLLAQHPEGAERQQAAWRLATAAESMDDAAVFTIDAWCQRMLREHAFDSGCLFDEELQANEAAMQAEAVRDYWRAQVYPLSESAMAAVLSVWKDIDALAQGARDLRDQPLPAEAGQGSLGDCVERVLLQRADRISTLKQGWSERAAEMRAWLEPLWTHKDKPINGKALGPANGRRWLDELARWAEDPQAEVPKLGKGAERLTHAGVVEALKADHRLDPPACFGAFTGLVDDLTRIPEIGPSLRLHAAARIRQRLQQLKAQAGTFGFADMLSRLNDALDDTARGDAAQRLRQRIVDQYPVALIDEFQDTSPVQLGIFDRLYRLVDNAPAQALLLIGDPKQAIYSFRGADIHSYLQARDATRGRHHMLGTNHRSSVALVAAVNALFQAAETRVGEGAFRFGRARGAEAGDDTGLPFVAVRAQGRAEHLVTAVGEAAPLVMALDPDLTGQPASRERQGAWCAERIVSLLNDPEAGFVDAEGFVRLRPADIAVLVRSAREATAVRRALRRRGVASVYLSDKDTVFASDEAADLLRLLQAVAAPRNARLARAALATALLGFPLEDLVRLASDDERFDAQCEQLAQLQVAWQTRGVLAMVRQALHHFGLPARWLAGDAARLDGERRLTNVLHLAELLQTASAQFDGEHALIRWMSRQIDDAEAESGADDERVLRLESDADLVKVVTVHKSKGLEYPLVFLPYAAHVRPVERSRTPSVTLVESDGRRALFLSPTDEQLAARDLDRQREDLRLLYVALTRARHQLWVGVTPLKLGRSDDCVWHRSALGYLVSGPDPRSADQVGEDVRALAVRVPGLQLVVPATDTATAAPAVTRLRPREAAPPVRPAAPYQARFDRQWSISSYSALVKEATRGPAADGVDRSARVVRDDEPIDASAGEAVRRAADQPWHRFPRGVLVGNFLHDQLEWLAGERFALHGSLPLQQALARRCERQGYGQRSEDVLAWLGRVCETPLPPLGCALSGLDRVLPEMEFWLPSDGLRVAAVDALCRQHVLPGRARPELPERALRGLLMGFADLVFGHGGRYGVLDYKSNALGTRDADYTPAAMEAAMLEHRYDVQAALYLLALHRLLRSRLGARYRPAEHLHGAVYLFLRGVGGPAAGCFHLPAPIALIEALDAMLAAPPVAAAEQTR